MKKTRGLLLCSGVAAALLLASDTTWAQGGTWVPTSVAGAPCSRSRHTAVWTGSRMVIWGGWGSVSACLDVGAAYDPTTDTWMPTSTVNAPSARYAHTAAWTGSKMIVWGGTAFPGGTYLDTGAAYDPTTDTWTPTSTGSGPSAREQHTAVWTGSRMIVWGGHAASGLNTGAAYDPATDTWTPTNTANAPSARWGHTAVWTGSRMIVWGGYGGGGYLDTGAAYDPTTDTWTPTDAVSAPSARYGATAVWTGSRMIVWGGHDSSVSSLNTGAAYDPTTDTWLPTSTVNAPSVRYAHTAAWTGSRMIIWGGRDGDVYLDTGAAYEPTADTWTPTNTVNVPSARYDHTAIRAGSTMIVWGGYASVDVNTGSAYDPLLGHGFYSVTPCRLVDTRQPDGPLGGPALVANASRDFVVVGHCGIPATAQALSVNLTATEETVLGHLRLYAGETTPPDTSSLNYSAGQTRANNAIVMLGTRGNVGVRCVQASGTAHVIIDVSGYFE